MMKFFPIIFLSILTLSIISPSIENNVKKIVVNNLNNSNDPKKDKEEKKLDEKDSEEDIEENEDIFLNFLNFDSATLEKGISKTILISFFFKNYYLKIQLPPPK